MDIDERIRNLVAAGGSTPIEQELLHAPVLSHGPHLTAHPGSGHPIVVVLDTRRSGFFKAFTSQSANMCANFNQDRLEATLHEVIAWRLALAMGSPWMQMVPTAVLRRIDGKGGAVSVQSVWGT